MFFTSVILASYWYSNLSAQRMKISRFCWRRWKVQEVLNVLLLRCPCLNSDVLVFDSVRRLHQRRSFAAVFSLCDHRWNFVNVPELGRAEYDHVPPFHICFQVRVLRRNTTGGRLLLCICSMSTSAPPGWRPKIILSCWVRILNLKTVY